MGISKNAWVKEIKKKKKRYKVGGGRDMSIYPPKKSALISFTVQTLIEDRTRPEPV